MLANEIPTVETMNLQLMRLLAGVSGQGKLHLTEVETDMMQMNALLDEAIRKLGVSFMAIHSALGRQQEVVNALLAGKVSAAECTPVIEGIQGEIGLHINAAVTSLQFQDMTSQLIGGMGRNLAELRGVFGALDEAEADISPGAGEEEILDVLDAVNHRVASMGEGKSCMLQKPVSQRHMESGDIELF